MACLDIYVYVVSLREINMFFLEHEIVQQKEIVNQIQDLILTIVSFN